MIQNNGQGLFSLIVMSKEVQHVSTFTVYKKEKAFPFGNLTFNICILIYSQLQKSLIF